MIQLSPSPSIEVTIGRQCRLYHAFITCAPCELDAPSTVTLCAAPLSDVALLAANAVVLDAADANACARLVLVDATELAWQRARSREAGHFLAPADDGLVGQGALQRWLWQRLQEPSAGDAEA